MNHPYRFYEFFAGGGMARAGLGDDWECLFANDFDARKAASYRANWGADHFKCADVAGLTPADLPGDPDLAWASFPCQDLSLAGARAGIRGERSGTFWPFWRLIEQLHQDRRSPRAIVLENVYGALRSHGGADFAAIGEVVAALGYRFGAMIMDAVNFVPQSRPRLFVVCIREDIQLPDYVVRSSPDPVWHPQALVDAWGLLGPSTASQWIWWDPGLAPSRGMEFADLVEDNPQGVAWHTPEMTLKLLAMMTETNQAKVREAKQAGRRMVGGLYRRTRQGVQRAEVRFDVSGCLRTPAGGSSRQTILVVEGKKVHSRLLSPREAARLMGLPDSYKLPEKYNDAYHLAGDGVVVPVVRFLAETILEPVLQTAKSQRQKAAA